MKIINLNKMYLKNTAKIMVEDYWDSIEKAKNELLTKMISGECFIALEGNEVLGVFIYTRDYSHYANYLEDIVVAKKHQRKGVAFELLKKYILVSKKETPLKQKYALSSTNVSNISSVKMHLKFWFKKMGILKSLHYGKNELFFSYDLRGIK